VVEYPVFQPVLTAGEIAEVEAQYGVTLPGEYRSFLAEVAAGGPGPDLYLTSLRQVGGRWVWVKDGHYWVLDPSGPFMESEEWAEHQARILRAAGHEPGARDDPWDSWEDYRRALGAGAGNEAWELERGRGAILISDHGCGMTSWLIVVGPHRGELRFRDCGVNPPFDPHVDADGNRHTFYTWYIEWLERRETEAGSQRRRS
jgi:SMI1/KNR4 family protein SUKH-1